MLIETLSAKPGACVAIVGAGGKTALCWRLTQELAQSGAHVLFTTTTRIRQPAPGVFDLLVIEPDIDLVRSRLAQADWHTACIAACTEGVLDDTPIADSTMPVVHTKLTGFSGTQICRLHSALSTLRSPHYSFVEADGARSLLIKAPAEHEPAIPACATIVCVVASLNALGLPLDERTAHRPEIIARLTHTQPGQAITPQTMIELLSHPQGGLKNVSPAAKRITVLTQREGPSAHPDAAHIAGELVKRGFDCAVVLTLLDDGAKPLHVVNARMK